MIILVILLCLKAYTSWCSVRSRVYDVVEGNLVSKRNLNNYKYDTEWVSDDNTKIAERIRELFNKAVNQTLMGRRNIGLFLSGGIDSTSILYEMKELGVKPNTFTSEFELLDPKSRLNEDSDLAKGLLKDLKYLIILLNNHNKIMLIQLKIHFML